VLFLWGVNYLDHLFLVGFHYYLVVCLCVWHVMCAHRLMRLPMKWVQHQVVSDCRLYLDSPVYTPWMFLLVPAHLVPWTTSKGLVAEMIQTTGDIGTQWILDICNGIVKEGCMQEDWKSSVLYEFRKERGIQWSANYLMEWSLNIFSLCYWEHKWEHRNVALHHSATWSNYG